MKLNRLCKALAGSAIVLLFGFASGGSAFAQANGECSCVVPGDATGQVVSAAGNVQVSQANGFGPAGAGTPLSRGSRIIVGLQSEAETQIGSCRLRIPQNNDVLFDLVGDNICVRAKPANGQTAGQGNGSNTATVVVVGAAAIGGFVALAVSGSDSVSD